jgi:replication factor A1
MKVSELKDKAPVDVIELEIESVSEARDTSYGKVANAAAKDDTGTVQLSLWNEQIGQFNAGDKVIIKNGWSKTYRDEMQVSAGKFGTLEKA